MNTSAERLVSIVVPVHNEQAGLQAFHESLSAVLATRPEQFEIVYCDDGSTDHSAQIIRELAHHDSRICLVALTRNFGKEIAITAGLHEASGDAIITLDADGQHPVDLIPEFLTQWHKGSMVVIGRRKNRQASGTKRIGTALFYGAFRRLTGMKLEADATDFRLIDKQVQAEFNRMTERNRITRGLIDWLGYERSYVPYDENSRLAGNATYSLKKLMKLAIDSMVSLSLSPLYLVAYIGAVVLPLSTLAGLAMLINFLTGDPLHLHATTSAYLIVLILFLIGVLLVSQGIIGLYLSHIHTETQNRPLYIIDKTKSAIEHAKNS